ncbi:MAG: response regulator [Nitrospinaceae bacterium]|jgi:CheY-like chemotaxis protein|nr:response regulator [Nitrospinaceae bacterium]MBT3433263.1 response regulator [Nitrospinaceae bacterium]MBT3823285.1 response regulator [Nitrospinaceae bacterium]MBT4092990.1 response regulator [Nitrospinaceae bacterium]MBT4432638.1 response regulator [Nitrospinaceae bacterium]
MAAHKLLLVDDEVVGLEIMKDLLESSGYQIETAQSGTEALEKFSPEIDLIVLDVMLPGMDGYEVAEQVRSHATHGDVPIIFLTALKSEEDKGKAIKAGASDFVTKPVDIEDMEKRIAHLLEKVD